MANLEDEKSLQDELSLPILLADWVIKAAQEAESSQVDCGELAKQVERLSTMLRSTVRLTNHKLDVYISYRNQLISLASVLPAASQSHVNTDPNSHTRATVGSASVESQKR